MIQIEEIIDSYNEILLSDNNIAKYPSLKGVILTLLKTTSNQQKFTTIKTFSYKLVLTKGHNMNILCEYSTDILLSECKEDTENIQDVTMLNKILQLIESNNGIVQLVLSKLSND